MGGVTYGGWKRTSRDRRVASLEEKRTITADGCWEWTGSVMLATGYGQYRTPGQNLLVHRLSYEEYVGPIGDGLVLHHTCENRLCFNPEHLTPMTRGEHVRIHRAYATCPRCGSAEPRIQEFRNGKPNGSKCRSCTNAARLRRYHERKAHS